MSYQERDAHIVDYQLYELPGVRPYPGDGMFRGPRVASDRYIACIGAAQVFGCFCPRPFPALLAERLGVETMNLGHGGAAPTFHRSNARLLRYINDARLVIVQVMSGRSQSSSAFRVTHHGMEGVRTRDGLRMTAQEFFEDLVEHSPERVAAVVQETKANYVRDMIALLDAIRPPTILFWFSQREPRYRPELALPIWRLLGAFPHLVDEPMLAALRARADEYVECVSRRGLPQKLYDRHGQPTTVRHSYNLVHAAPTVSDVNSYYPSPEMHADAADALEAACRRLLA